MTYWYNLIGVSLASSQRLVFMSSISRSFFWSEFIFNLAVKTASASICLCRQAVA